jgi:zinc protease
MTMRFSSIQRRVLPPFAVLLLSVVFLTLPVIIAARAAVTIQEVKSPGGVTAWLVEDYTVPIITIRFAFEGGSTQDPTGKEGLANLMSGLLDEGAGELDSDTFQTKLDDAGAEMRFNAGRDAFYGSMRMLADQKDEALDLLKLAIEKPRFDAEPVDRIRSQIVSGILGKARDPQMAAQIAWFEALYGDHAYARRDEGTEASLGEITPDDLRHFHATQFARGNLKIGVVGAIDAETLEKELDRLFGGLPERPELVPVSQISPKLGQDIDVPYDLPQSTLQLAYPGIERSDPQFFAAYLMNHILGGGTFSSRLFTEVREKRGLAYGIGSSLVNSQYSSSLVISTATRSDRAAETLDIIKEEVKRMAEEGPTQAELDAAKKYVAGAYAVNNLDSSTAIASTLVELQIDELGIDYIQQRTGLIDAVTLEDVKAVAKRLLSAEPAVMVVGPALPKG